MSENLPEKDAASPVSDEELMMAVRHEPLLVELSDEKQRTLVKLLRLVETRQAQMNLTAIRNPLAMVRYHMADSLALGGAVEDLPVRGELEHAADIGTGAGFPLLPMAVLWPHVEWVGIESVGKKANFVKESALALDLSNVDVWPARAEEVGRSEYRDAFDLVTSRAVGPVSALLEVSMPLLRLGGRVYLFKTEATGAEWAACGKLLKKLGGRPAGEYRYSLEGDERQRVIFVAEKTTETPQEFPRLPGLPFKKPLVKLDDGGRAE